MNSVGDLFKEEPEQWGLRGDQYLWRELKNELVSVALPSTSSELQRFLENAFWNATQVSLAFFDEIFVERYSHGGMSSGYISGEFWRERGFPLIVERFLELRKKVKEERHLSLKEFDKSELLPISWTVSGVN